LAILDSRSARMNSLWYENAAAERRLSAGERRLLKRFEVICRHFARLERAVHGDVQFELPTSTSSKAAFLKGSAVEQGGALAKLERERLKLGNDPLDDIEGLLDRMGIKLVRLPLERESRIAGGFFFDSDVGPCIMVNGSLAAEEQLVAAAHEYCHFLADYNPYLPRICFLDEAAGSDPSEARAAGFAAAFLVPEESLSSLMTGREGVTAGEEGLRALGVYYGVPVWAVARRLEEIGVPVAGVPAREEDAGPTRGAKVQELPRRFVRLALEARARGLVSPLRMARLLQVDVATAEGLYEYFSSEGVQDEG